MLQDFRIVQIEQRHFENKIMISRQFHFLYTYIEIYNNSFCAYIFFVKLEYIFQDSYS